MGGKASQSTQQIQIPPEVLARYNSVNATAERAAQTPFQQYSTDPNAFVAPLTATQNAGIAGTNYYSGAAQPYYQAATQQLGAAQGAATPYYQQATQQVGQAQNVGNMLGGASLGALAAGQAAADPLQQQASSGLSAAYGQAQPFNQAAANQYQRALGQGQSLTQGALGGVQGAYAGAQPFQNLASQYMGAGAQAVNPGELGSNQINQFMSPYLSNVLQGTAGMLNQQNQQAMSGQTGNAIRQGAFGGDRAGIAAANLAQQQQLANAQTYSGILNQGYGQALSAAQGQQQLGLGAQQANRAAQQQASQQALGIGQQGFGQGLSAAQQQAALGQQLYGMGSGTGQNLASLGQQIYGQGTGTAQQQAALGQQLFGQGTTASQQLANIGQQQFGQGMTAAQQNAALGAGIYGMGSQTAQGLANLGVGVQGAGLQGAQAQLAAGLGQQQTQQAGQTALYNQFLQQQSYPFQTAQFLANIAEGTGALSGSTTTTNQALGGFSDKRLKENIKPIGKTFDGQNIYSYNFKGHPQTEIGLIAQEVEKHHPEAVGLAGGYKTVRYDKATDDAADRGHFAAGGAASMGGGVMPEHAGLGFADGGYAGFDPALMQQLMAAYQQMYAPMQGQNGGLGAKGYVPEATAANFGSLPTPAALAAPETAMDQASKAVSTGTGIDTLGKDLGLWDDEDSPKKDRRDRLQKDFDKTFAHKAAGGLAGARHGYGPGGSTDNSTDDPNEIVVTAAKQPAPAPEPKKIDVPSATPAAAPLAQVAKVDKQATSSKPSINTSSLNIPQVGNTVGLTPAAALTPLEDHTMEGIGSMMSGIGSMALGFSDKRLKENIKPVGKTFDGQTVYSYNYKGDHQTRMGLIAQEVEKKHPEAVKKVNGYRMVDYHKATGLAAHRGHFADGGDADSTDDTSAFGGPSIPMQGNAVGLNGAAGLTPLQDNTMQGLGSMMSGIGSIAGAFKKKKAAGGLAGDGGMFPELDQNNQPGVPDFNLDPEDIISGGDQQFESLLRHKPEEAPKPNDSFAAASERFRKEMEARKNAPHGMGLAAAPPAAHAAHGAGPRSVRNNNPGNIEDGPLAKSMPGYAGSDGRFAIFNAPQAGRAAQMNLIRSYIHRGYNTPWEIANRWAPGTEKGNNPAAYANSIAKMVGVGIHDTVPMTAIPLVANAQTIVEGGPRALSHFVPNQDGEHFASGGLAGRTGYALGGGDDEDTGDAPQGLGALLNRRVENEAPRVSDAAQPAPAVAGPGDEIQVTAAPSKPAPVRKPPKGFGLSPQQNFYEQKPNVVLGGDTANYGHDYYSEPFFKGLKHGSAQSWIPLLTGLGTFATTPTRSMLGGVLAGVGAGAQTYGNLADTRNKQLPMRQAAAAQQANVARQLADNFFRLAPDGENFTFTKPNGETILVTPGQKQGMLQQMLTGSGQYMPATPEGAPAFRADTSAPKDYKYQSTVPPSNDSVEGIIAGANANPTVAQYYNQREQAKADMADQQRLIHHSQFASNDDILRATTRLKAAEDQFTASDKQYNDALRAIADPMLQAYGTSVTNIGTANLETYGKTQERVMAYQPIIPVLEQLKMEHFTGGATSTLWNNISSAALALGVSPDVVGNGQKAAQRQAALAALLAGTGISPAALSVENSPEATEAVVKALDRAIRNAQYQADTAAKSLRPTATPTINRATGARPPAPAPAAPRPTTSSPSVRINPAGDRRWAVNENQVGAAMNDPRIKSGDTIIYRDRSGNIQSRMKP